MKWVVFFLFLIGIGTSSYTFAQSSAELKRRKDALTREIEALNSNLNQTSSNKKMSLKQIKALNTQIRLRESKIGTINSEIFLLKNQISKNTSTVHSLQTEVAQLKQEYGQMIRFAFRNKDSYNQLVFIFAAQDFNQAYKRLKYLHQIGEYRRRQAKEMQDTQRRLNVKIMELGHNKQEKDHLLKDQEREKQTLGKEKSTQAKVLTGLTKQEKEIKQELSQKQRESARLNKAIQNAINREIEEARRRAEAEAKAAAAAAAAANKAAPAAKVVAKGSSILASTPEAAKLSSDFASSRGNLPWPVANGVIMESFGMHRYGANVKTENNGIDIKTAVGSTVRAIFAGEVATVQNIVGSYVVLIRHGEYFTVYSNLRSVSVSKGQKVLLKQAIGTVLTDTDDGTTEVHFEVRKGASPLNPESWLAK